MITSSSLLSSLFSSSDFVSTISSLLSFLFSTFLEDLFDFSLTESFLTFFGFELPPFLPVNVKNKITAASITRDTIIKITPINESLLSSGSVSLTTFNSIVLVATLS